MLLLFLAVSSTIVEAQTPSLLVGTDIPYQLHMGAAFDLENFRFSVRSGVLAGPYSTLTLSLIETLGTDEIYISLLESSYQFGFMNGVAFQYKFGKKKLWSIGPEMRFDYLTASDTSEDLIEAITGESIFPNAGIINKEQELSFDLMMYAIGIRVSRALPLDSQNRHHLLLDISFYKHYMTQTHLFLNQGYADRISETLNDLLWEDVFLPYGYLAGFGLSYRYAL